MVNRFWRQHKHSQGRERGQSLVEMVFIVPILLFIFMGLIEVGWAIRGYLVLLSAGRETARFAARGDSLDFSGVFEDANNFATDEALRKEIAKRTGYARVLRHANELLSINGLGLSLGLDFSQSQPDDPFAFNNEENGTMIVTHVLVDTGLPCNPGAPNCDCNQFMPEAAGYPNNSAYELDDLVLHPDRNGYQHFQYTAGITNVTSRVDMDTLLAELKAENNLLNCNILKRTQALTSTTSLTSSVGVDLSINSVIIVEAFYDQKQVLGAPLISNTLTDPVPLYNSTFMRIATSTQSQGEGCELFPVSIPDQVYNDTQTYQLPDTWLRWIDSEPADKPAYLVAALRNPRLVINAYDVASDKALNVGDQVIGLGAPIDDTTSIEAAPGQFVLISDYLSTLRGRTVTLPKVTGQIVQGFERMVFLDYDLANGELTFQGLGPQQGQNEACPTREIINWENTP